MRVFPALAAILLQLLATASDAEATSCTAPTTPTSVKPAKVLVVLSTCLTAATRSTIDTWLGNLKSREMIFIQGEDPAVIEYDYKVLQDTLTCGGAIDPTKNLAKMAAAEFTKYSGLISFATTPRSTTALEFAATKIGYAAKFQVCEKSLSGADEDRGCKKDPNYIYLANVPSELPNFNPFRQVVSKLYCATAPKRSLAYSVLDTAGTTRTCTCDCAPGMIESSGSCVPNSASIAECTWWNNVAGGLTTLIVTSQNAKIALSNACNINKMVSGIGVALPVLTPISRTHDDDGVVDYATLITSTSIGTEISRAATSVNGTTLVNEPTRAVPTEKYTWSDYLASSTTKLDRVTFPGYGNYYVTLFANDYRSSERCGGTFTIIDNFRPTGEPALCPMNSKNTEVGVVIPTALTVAKLNNEVNAVYTFKRTAVNDACSVTSKNRCDEDTLTLKTFTNASSKTSSILTAGEGFFAKDVVAADLAAKLAMASTAPPDPTYTCSRCARAATTLKEWWTEYKGDSAVANRTCDGASKCDVSRCLKVSGPTLVTATVKIEGSLKIKSAGVAAALGEANVGDADLAEYLKANYPTDDGSTIYLPLDCSAYLTDPPSATVPNACTYRNKVVKMFTMTAAAAKDSIISSVASYVRWEYQIDGGNWKKLASTTADEVFYNPSTAVTIRAWTNCGVAVQQTFYVKLYVNNPVNICDSFSEMWWQGEMELPAEDELCLLPKSNFADVVFMFHPGFDLEQQPDTFKMGISRVQCQLQYDARTPVSVFNVTSESALPGPLVIARDFAVTAAVTPAKLTTSCTFTYTRAPLAGAPTSTSATTCTKDFTIRDCLDSVASTPIAADAMCAKKCTASSTIANLYDACSGDRIGSSSTKSLMSQGERACCSSCLTDSGYEAQCLEVFPDAPAQGTYGFNPIKRCVPVDLSAPPPSTF